VRISDQQAQKRRGSRGQPYEYATRGPCGEVEVGRMGGGWAESVCAVPVQTCGSWGCEWGWVWLRVAGCGLGFYCSSALTFVALCCSLFAKLRRPMRSIWMEPAAQLATSRGCRVLEVVPPYLWAVYSNGLVARHARSSSERCPEHVTTRCSQMLRVQTREGAQRFMWGCSTRCVGQGWCIIVYGAVGK